jgi:hypothetical protein
VSDAVSSPHHARLTDDVSNQLGPGWEAEELDRRCTVIQELQLQGVPLLRRDYIALVLATVLVPLVLIALGSLP